MLARALIARLHLIDVLLLQRRVGNIVLFANTDVPLDPEWNATANPVVQGDEPLKIDAYLSAAFGYQARAFLYSTSIIYMLKYHSCLFLGILLESYVLYILTSYFVLCDLCLFFNSLNTSKQAYKCGPEVFANDQQDTSRNQVFPSESFATLVTALQVRKYDGKHFFVPRILIH